MPKNKKEGGKFIGARNLEGGREAEVRLPSLIGGDDEGGYRQKTLEEAWKWKQHGGPARNTKGR